MTQLNEFAEVTGMTTHVRLDPGERLRTLQHESLVGRGVLARGPPSRWAPKLLVF